MPLTLESWGLWYKHLNNGLPSAPDQPAGRNNAPKYALGIPAAQCPRMPPGIPGWAPPSDPSHLGEPPQLDSLAATWLMPVCQSQNKPPGNRRWAAKKPCSRKAMFSCPDSCQSVFSENWLLLCQPLFKDRIPLLKAFLSLLSLYQRRAIVSQYGKMMVSRIPWSNDQPGIWPITSWSTHAL